MKTLKNNSGFTLLEVIIVIIIIGVLASLALPRLSGSVQFSYATEARNAIVEVRKAIENCGNIRGNFTGCDDFTVLTVDDPTNSVNSHFSYSIVINGAGAGYTITAQRLGNDGGDGTSTIELTNTGAAITNNGTGVFASIRAN